MDALAMPAESLKIGIAPVVRMSPIGVMRLTLGRRSTVLVSLSYNYMGLREDRQAVDQRLSSV
jgi:hypothetical protein